MKFLKKMLNKNTLIWCINFIFSIILIFIGTKLTRNKFINLHDKGSALEATVTEIINEEKTSYEYDGKDNVSLEITFKAQLKDGKIVEATETIDDYSGNMKKVAKNDKIFIYQLEEDIYYFGDYKRSDKIFILLIIFCILLVVFGGMKGINTLVSLIFTCLSIFMFFLPSILSGYNVYFCSIITCIYIIIMTLLFINGWSKKTFTTILGCIFGVVTAGIIFVIMNKFLNLSGVACEDELYLQMLDVKINLKALIFAAIIISSMGAVMDVSMDISSAIAEIKMHKENIKFKEMLKSGLNIGRDIMGTMSNTLILAFIGKALSTTLLIITYSSSLNEIFNKELIVINMLEALIGSLSILLTAPITSLICAYLYTNKEKNC